MGANDEWAEAGRALAALQRFVLKPAEQVDRTKVWPTQLVVFTGRRTLVAEQADWLVGREPWVESAIRVVAEESYVDNTSYTHGLLFPRGGDVLYLNHVATLQRLGGRLGADLDPVAYAQILSELGSGPPEDGPVLRPRAATSAHRAGELVRDVAAVKAEYHWVDPALLAPPAVRGGADTLVLEFSSVHYYLTGLRAVDVLHWRVTGRAGHPASWRREYAAQRLEHL